NVASGQEIATLQGHSGWVLSVSWSPDGKTLATGSFDKTVKLWNVASGQEIATLQGHSGGVSSVSWSPDGKTLATDSYDNTVKLWPMTIDGLLDKACAYLKPYLTNPDHPERNSPKVCDYPSLIH
ncbi:WD40 repeat domain-containing protein, partial [Limnothrix redekei]